MLGLDLKENKTLPKEEPSKSSVKKKVTIATEAKKNYWREICMVYMYDFIYRMY